MRMGAMSTITSSRKGVVCEGGWERWVAWMMGRVLGWDTYW